jgi:hypothetical protein
VCPRFLFLLNQVLFLDFLQDLLVDDVEILLGSLQVHHVLGHLAKAEEVLLHCAVFLHAQHERFQHLLLLSKLRFEFVDLLVEVDAIDDLDAVQFQHREHAVQLVFLFLERCQLVAQVEENVATLLHALVVRVGLRHAFNLCNNVLALLQQARLLHAVGCLVVWPLVQLFL